MNITVNETLGDYMTHLKYERRIKPTTMRAIELSLRYFTELYGIAMTKDLQASDIYIFYEHLGKLKKVRPERNGERKLLTNVYIQKVMTHLKTFVKRLSNKGYLKDLCAADVPLRKAVRRTPLYLSKEELGQIMQYLEQAVIDADKGTERRLKYAAYMWRALVRMLYTTGLRNAELRSLTYDDIIIPELSGTILGKGDKFGAFTFSEAARVKLQDYLRVRAEIFPKKSFRYIFTSGANDTGHGLAEQGVNKILKKIAERAGIDKNVHAHTFRHSLAVHLLQSGRGVTAVRDKLRHSSIAVTDLYSQNHPETLQKMSKDLGQDLMLAYNSLSV